MYKLTEDLAIIHTLDFFTPVVDDPYDYGAIAAANAMSDVYAMGGKVVMALNICTFPSSLSDSILQDILRGGAEKVSEAGASLAGGHTVDDPEPKYGLAVMGVVHPERVASKQGARPGDILILTKSLGTGAITTALKRDKADPAHVAAAVTSMKTLNAGAAAALRAVQSRACTDVTGFSLLGHAADLAGKSEVALEINIDLLPFLPGAQEYAEQDYLPGGTGRNMSYYGDNVRCADVVTEHLLRLAFTPETSGGLLTAIPSEDVGTFRDICAQNDTVATIVGRVKEGRGIDLC